MGRWIGLLWVIFKGDFIRLALFLIAFVNSNLLLSVDKMSCLNCHNLGLPQQPNLQTSVASQSDCSSGQHSISSSVSLSVALSHPSRVSLKQSVNLGAYSYQRSRSKQATRIQMHFSVKFQTTLLKSGIRSNAASQRSTTELCYEKMNRSSCGST